jgi:hypothetical protein
MQNRETLIEEQFEDFGEDLDIKTKSINDLPEEISLDEEESLQNFKNTNRTKKSKSLYNKKPKTLAEQMKDQQQYGSGVISTLPSGLQDNTAGQSRKKKQIKFFLIATSVFLF